MSKFAIFNSEILEFEMSIEHSSKDLQEFNKITDQFNFRKDLIMKKPQKIQFSINLTQIGHLFVLVLT